MQQIVKQVESISIRVQKELVLLHKPGVAHPKGTVKWLNALGWLSSYFHVSSENNRIHSDDINVINMLQVRCPDYFFTWTLTESVRHIIIHIKF